MTGRPDPSPGDYDPAAYGENCAAFYDHLYPAPRQAQIDLLLALAGDGPALDLGVGTGRVALPLARRGCAVWGLDTSPRMLRVCRLRGTDLPVHAVRADISDFHLPLRFTLVFCLVDTLFLLPPSYQDAVFSCVARHLAPGGSFLVESHSHAGAPRQRMQVRVQTAAGEYDYRAELHPRALQVQADAAAAAGLASRGQWRDWQQRPWRAGDAHCITRYG